MHDGFGLQLHEWNKASAPVGVTARVASIRASSSASRMWAAAARSAVLIFGQHFSVGFWWAGSAAGRIPVQIDALDNVAAIFHSGPVFPIPYQPA